jgi:DNA/RNA endonuclease YhcR with UshA esterase domain
MFCVAEARQNASTVCVEKTIFILAVFAFAVELSAQETNSPALLKISAVDTTNYYDKEMIVTGKVAQVTIRPTVTFLNLDKKYPASPFEIVIFHGKSSFYGDANALKGKSIEVRGTIKKFKDKPEIVLDSTNQLTVLGVTNLEFFLKPITPAAPSTNSFPEIM